jgi:hypothetical protein
MVVTRVSKIRFDLPGKSIVGINTRRESLPQLRVGKELNCPSQTEGENLNVDDGSDVFLGDVLVAGIGFVDCAFVEMDEMTNRLIFTMENHLPLVHVQRAHFIEKKMGGACDGREPARQSCSVS